MPSLSPTRKQLGPPDLLPRNNFTGLVKTYQVKNCLAKIDVDRIEFHGTPPRSPLILPADGSQMVRTIPLVTTWQDYSLDEGYGGGAQCCLSR